MKDKARRFSAVIVSSLVVFAVIFLLAPIKASAEEQKIVTQYDDLWTDDITVKAGTPVKWYVYVPEGTEPKGCGATIKIPDLGFGTDTHNKEEGHIELKQGENFIYEFTPETEGDILFTCWMGSGCHKNYIHAVADESADSSKADSSSESKAETDSSKPDSDSSQAPSEDGYQKIVTEYSDLWTGTVSAKKGVPVKWYVNVPEGTEPKGCGATIKIPDLGFGTDTHNKDEGHIVLTQGENFIYEFTPEETGDILFTCWMGSGCHSNYFHITEDGTYSVPKPEDPTEISAVRTGSDIKVSFKAPDAPEGSKIRGYKVIATDEDGSRKKGSGTESPITIEGLDNSKNYIITITTLATSGKSEGTNSYILKALNAAPVETKSSSEVSEDTGSESNAESAAETESESSSDSSEVSEPDPSAESTTKTDPGSSAEPESEASPESKSEPKPEASSGEQIILTNYADLWTSNITVKKGVHVKWYVNVPAGTEPKGCAATIKIPDLGFGTDTHNKEEGHIELKQGENFIYEFTPETEGDILFTCWMGSGCHYNYIHVTTDGIADPSAKTGGKAGTEDTHHDSSSDSSKSASGSISSNSGNTSANPSTGAETPFAAELILILSAGVAYTLRKRN